MKRLRPQRKAMSKKLILFILIFCWIPLLTADEIDYTKLDIEELLKIEIVSATSASRKQQSLLETASALSVITQEDIRRSGATHLAEALRLVPGIQVARMNANKWAISARGFNNAFASKLLVMIDGRSVYSTLRSEVNWDMQNVLLEDVERIEVVRGPRASLWGANAVNGIINIVTKSAKKTQGNLITAQIGIGEEENILGIRHGGQLTNNSDYRIYAKTYKHNSFLDAQGDELNDNWEIKQAGFRNDWHMSEQKEFTIQADVYDGFARQRVISNSRQVPFNDEVDFNGFNVLGRWEQKVTNGNLILQTYYDFAKRNDYLLEDSRGNFDIDFQRLWIPTANQEYVWGLGFRHTYDEVIGLDNVRYIPSERKANWYSGFLQADFIVPAFADNETSWDNWEFLRFTLGTKVEHNDYSQFEIQPTARVFWTPVPNHHIWLAVSRAIHTPSRTDQDSVTEIDTPEGYVLNVGNPDFRSESVIAYELGYRFFASHDWLVDVNLFANDYDKLGSVEQIDSAGSPNANIVYQATNQLYGESYGIELASNWQIDPYWKLMGTYTFQQIQLHTMTTDRTTTLLAEDIEHNSPRNQASLRSLFNLSTQWELDTTLYYVDNLSSQHIHAYTRFDARLGWRPYPNGLEISAGVRNLFDNQHPEFVGNIDSNSKLVSSEVPRTLYLQLKYRF